MGEPIEGAVTEREGYEQPVYYWDPVIAPSGMQFYTGDAFPAWRGSLFIGGLVSQRLVRLVIKDNRVVGEEQRLLKRQICNSPIADECVAANIMLESDNKHYVVSKYALEK